jgi:cyclic beta-1,2-glucan synthetase
MEIVVSAEDNAEVRRISLTNNSTRTREIELTSYSEVVLRARRRCRAPGVQQSLHRD